MIRRRCAVGDHLLDLADDFDQLSGPSDSGEYTVVERPNLPNYPLNIRS